MIALERRQCHGSEDPHRPGTGSPRFGIGDPRPHPPSGAPCPAALRLGRRHPPRLSGLTCLYAQDKGVYARREDGEVFALRLRLYELEQRLDSHTFVRISHSEIVNLKKITALDLTLSGTIKISLADGAACYVSRRYVKKIKQALGL